MPLDREPILTYLAEKIGGDRGLLPKGNVSLVDEGILDSFGLADLVAFLEKSYGVKVPDKDLALANFDSIDKIAGYVEARR
jgi:acyl carrier protein